MNRYAAHSEPRNEGENAGVEEVVPATAAQARAEAGANARADARVEHDASEGRHGYIRAGDKAKLQQRLRRIEGQVRGIQRMLDEDAYCVDVLTQLASIVSASERVGGLILKDHMNHCVRQAIENGEEADGKVEEMVAAVERFLRV